MTVGHIRGDTGQSVPAIAAGADGQLQHLMTTSVKVVHLRWLQGLTDRKDKATNTRTELLELFGNVFSFSSPVYKSSVALSSQHAAW